MTPVPDAAKDVWRAWAKAERLRLPVERISADVVDHLSRRLVHDDAQTILFYLPFGSEIDLRALPTSTAGLRRHRFAVTRTPAPRPLAAGELADPLTVHPLDSTMELHRFGMTQPIEGAPEIAFDKIDTVLVPGLAFDHSGTRLGFGAGYFDRLLPDMPRAARIGVVARSLVVAELPSEPHDQPMTELVTEAGIHPILRDGGPVPGAE